MDRAWRWVAVALLQAACANSAPAASSGHPGAGPQETATATEPPSHPATAGSTLEHSAGSTTVISAVLHFPPDVATPGPRLARELDAVAEILHANPSVEVEIGGHADPAEDPGVAHARANLVASSLAGRGIPRTRMKVRGYGHDQPAPDGKHRRVAFKVLSGS